MSKKAQHNEVQIEQNVMSKINDKNLRMQPKSYYVALGIASVFAIVLAIILATYFVSVATLFIRLQIAQGPAYGLQRNMDSLISTFPWQAVILGIIAIAAVIYLISKSGRMYKIRLAYLVPIVVAVVIAIGFAFSYSSLPNFGNRVVSGNNQSVKGYQYRR